MKRLLVTLGLAAGTAIAAACGSDAVHNVDYGQPPDAATFNPGLGGGDGYGYGSSGGNVGARDAGPPVCADELKRCAEEFTYPAGSEASVELRGDYRADAWTKGDAMTRSAGLWKVTVPVPYGKPVQYKLFVDAATWKVDTTKPTITDANNNTNNLANAITCTAFTCDEPPVPPPGVYDWRDAVIYFVFVDRFADGDATNNCNVAGTDSAGNYEGGDWAGVTQKIDAGYFNDLGANTLWLSVPFKNADTFKGHGVGGDTHQYSAYHGYWPFDPSVPDQCFGRSTGTDWTELKALVDAAHAKNLKVLFDYAMVHVVNTSPVFAAHNDWFYPNSNNGGDCICGQNCSWDADANRCWFTDYLPHWNYTVQAARDFSVNAAVALAKATGVDGFRLDAIKHVDDAYKGHPTGWLTQLRNQINTDILAKQNPPQRFYMVGETYDFGDETYIRSFVDPTTKLDGQFDFPERLDLVKTTLLRQESMDGPNGFVAFMDKWQDFYGATAVMSTFVGNHDLPRSIHLGEDTPMWSDPYADGKDRAWSNQPGLPGYRSPFERLGVAFAVLLTNKGAPLIYYGDEIGQPGAGDPDNRRMMQFSGLSADQQYLYNTIKALTAARAAHPALRRGRRATIGVTADAWVYSMTTTSDTVYVAINRGDGPANVSGLPAVPLTELVTGAAATGPTATVPPRQARLFVVK